MAYKLRRFKCADCDLIIERNAPAGATLRCLPHAIAFACEVQRQMHAKSGPHYEKWLARMAGYVATAQAAPEVAGNRYLAGMAQAVARG